MKMRSFKKLILGALALVLVSYVGCVPSSIMKKNINEISISQRSSKKQLEAFRKVKTVRLVVEQSFDSIPKFYIKWGGLVIEEGKE
jgi:hypothetical protein